MHKLNVLIIGPSDFVNTLNELKTFLKFNLFTNENKLNFKKVLSSFKVFTKWDGPIIKTFSLCI